MNRLARSLAVAATAGALTLLAAPASLAATSTTADPSCATISASSSNGDGQVTVCPLGGTTYQLSGYLETNMPYNFLDTPQCYTMDLYAGSTYLGGIGRDVCVPPTDDPSTSGTTKNTFSYTKTFSAMPTSGTFRRDWV